MRAILSVYDKSGLVELGRALIDAGYELVSTGGSQATLFDAGLAVQAVSDVTGFPEILDGRVKTLHPAIHGGILARQDDPEHQRVLVEHGIVPVQLVVANLYPFEATVRDPQVALAEAVEQIDIGGPAMIRAAAKNFSSVLVLTDPRDYPEAIERLQSETVDDEYRRAMAAKAFGHVSLYDSLVASYLRGVDSTFPEELTIPARLAQGLRYGENPQQQAAAYHRPRPGVPEWGVLDANQLAGKELSYNNILDADAAWNTVISQEQPAVAIIKHTNPCGFARRPTLVEAYQAALAGDPVSAFGGIVALNVPVDEATASELAELFCEVVIAPGFDEAALAVLGKKKNVRLLDASSATTGDSSEAALSVRSIRGGLLVQQVDDQVDDREQWRVVTSHQPDEHQWRDLRFAWDAVRHVKSNAIVLVRDEAVVGVGSGQPNRVESVAIAVKKAGERAAGAVLASDAFFPFPDGVEAAIAAGVTAIIQPGGSMRDEAVIQAAEAAGVPMVFTGTRHFLH